MRFFAALAVGITLLAFAACSGGDKGNLIVGEIEGLTVLQENSTASYQVSATGDTGIEFQWAVNPTSAGTFHDPETNPTQFTSAEVDSNLDAQIRMVVTSDHYGPIVKTLDIMITNKASDPPELQVSDIFGPTEIDEYSFGTFSVAASGDSGIVYQWSCVPSEAGVFTTPDKDTTVLSVGGVDIQTVADISVTVSSDNADPVERHLDVNILNTYDAAAFLGTGHPIEGVNYYRNNRSPNLLPLSLDADDSITPSYAENENFQQLVVSSDERLYLSGYHNYMQAMYKVDITQYGFTWSFHFGDDPGEAQECGGNTVLTEPGFWSISERYFEDSNCKPPNITGGGNGSSTLYKFGTWPQTLNTIGGNWYWQYICDNARAYGGDFDMKFFMTVMPLFNGNTLVSYQKFNPATYYGDWQRTPTLYLDLLDENLNVIKTWVFGNTITGFAFDEKSGRSYVSTASGLYCFDWDFNELWHTASQICDLWPVIADDGSILGVVDGILRRVAPDGQVSEDSSIIPFHRPVILNDGSIAVVSDSSILLLDNDLNQIGSIPLPAGPGSGASTTAPPLVDALDHLAIVNGADLYIIDIFGAVICHRTFDSNILTIRLGPDNLYVVTTDKLYRFPA